MKDKYILDIFAAEHYKDGDHILGFGFKKGEEVENFFDRKNFQLRFKDKCTIKELYDEFINLSVVIKDVIEAIERNDKKI